MKNYLAVIQHIGTKKYHGAYYQNKPTPSGCDRPILMTTTTDGFDNVEDAALAIEKAFPDMEKIPRE